MYGHVYTEKEKDFLAAFIPGHTYKEIAEKFSEKFGWQIKTTQVKGYMGNHGINNGLTGRFQKGHVPHNKGEKGICIPGSEKGWFQKGNVPINHRPVGSERVNIDGYIEIKVAEPDKWKLKHRVVWEEHHGKIPPNHIVIFADENKEHCDIENLRLIERGANLAMNRNGLRHVPVEFLDTAIGIANLNVAKSKAKKKKRRKK